MPQASAWSPTGPGVLILRALLFKIVSQDSPQARFRRAEAGSHDLRTGL